MRDYVVVTNLKTTKQRVKAGEEITIQVYGYSMRPEVGGYYLPFRLKSTKLRI